MGGKAASALPAQERLRWGALAVSLRDMAGHFKEMRYGNAKGAFLGRSAYWQRLLEAWAPNETVCVAREDGGACRSCNRAKAQRMRDEMSVPLPHGV